MTVLSQSRPYNNNTLSVHNAGQNTSGPWIGDPYSRSWTNVFMNSAGTSEVVISASTIWSSFVTASWVLYSVNQSVSGKVINMGYGGYSSAHYPSSVGSGDSADFITADHAFIMINGSSDVRRKFFIAHEIGHALALLFIDDNKFENFGSMDVNFNDDPYTGLCDAPFNSYFPQSVEYDAISWREGFAHFYASRVFNNRGESDVAFTWGTNTASAEYYDGPSTDNEGGYVKNVCDSTPVHGTSTNNDWMRFYWDIYDLPFCSPQASFADMLRLYRDTSALNPARWEFHHAVVDAADASSDWEPTCEEVLLNYFSDWNGIGGTDHGY